MRSINFLKAATLAATVIATSPTFSETTIKDGVYTLEQAASGKKVFDQYCAACHVKEFYQAQLMVWNQQPLIDLYYAMSGSMPEDNPGALALQEYTDVTAYIFSLLELPAGDTPLNHEDGSMAEIIIDTN